MMKKFVLLILALSSLSAFAGFERYYITKVYNHLGDEEVQVLSADELKQLGEDIRKEGSFHSMAMIRAKQEWKSNGEKGTFPSSAISQRRFMKTSAYKSRADAQDAISKREDNRRRAEEKKKERDEKRAKSNKNNKYNKNNKSKNDEARKKREAKSEANRADKRRTAEDAFDYYQRHLQDLIVEAEGKKNAK